MVQHIKIHGGPWHGRSAVLPDGRDHFHILAPEGSVQSFSEMAKNDSDSFVTIPKKEGTYSRVRYSPGDFEWDGWLSHD